MSALRGIPPDKLSHRPPPYHGMDHFGIDHTKCYTKFMNLKHVSSKSMQRFELSDGSIVFTTQLSLKALHSKLSQQLNTHVYPKNFDDVTLNQPCNEHTKNVRRYTVHNTNIIAQEFNIEHNPQDFTLCNTPPLSPTPSEPKKCTTVHATTKKNSPISGQVYHSKTT